MTPVSVASADFVPLGDRLVFGRPLGVVQLLVDYLQSPVFGLL